MTDWSQLHHAYGTAEDIPGLLDAVSQDPSDSGWSELWSRLCHQGTVYSASHATLPALRDMARRWSPADRQGPLLLAGAIAASTDQPHGEQDPHVAYAAEMSDLLQLTEEALRDPGLGDDPGTYVYLLAALLSFEGVDVWGEQLDGLNDDEYEVPCPSCSAENFIAFGEYGCFSTTDSMYMNETAAKKIPLQPADSSALEGLAQRLHSRALADNQADVAVKLTYLFGKAQCPECDDVFSVADVIATRWNG
ncbi:hypothetical protein [Streptomyces sp. NRRL S-455]|uniref:hypothetical protein n=1 Tax=Streptomyces sp. NRRL S-455 TaxID=1463908 RepID=UPI0004C1CA14|nr:hypothetical protein [Streptomyces sp. NRRL S-455]